MVFYSVNLYVDEKYYDCLDSFQNDEKQEQAKQQAEEYASSYDGDQEWFDDFTEYQFGEGHKSYTNWCVKVEEDIL